MCIRDRYETYTKLDDAKAFMDSVKDNGGKVNDELAGKEGSTKVTVGSNLSLIHI